MRTEGRGYQKSHRDQRHRRRSAWPAALFLLALVSAITWKGLTWPLQASHSAVSDKSNPVHVSMPAIPGRTNILLIGTDTRPGDPNGNSDVLVFCSIDEKNERIEMLSIPRDTKVAFPDGHHGKINEGLQLGGAPMTVSLVEDLLHQPIDHFALTRFDGLVRMIDTVGGVTIRVPERMYYVTGDKRYNIINLHKGEQTLNGEQALGFLRFRHDALGDIGRTERQQAFLSALAAQIFEPENLPKLPKFMAEFWGAVDTDMSMLDVMGLGSRAVRYKDYPILRETLPGSFHDRDPNISGDQSYWIVNPRQARYVARVLLDEGVVQTNPIQEPEVTEQWTPPARSTPDMVHTAGAT